MSAEARYFRVGLFVLLGAAAIVGAVLLLGGQALFQETDTFETYFTESVQGLEVGSPVKLIGVQIGEVTEIAFVADYYPADDLAERSRLANWVLVRIQVARQGRESESERFRERLRSRLIDRGLRMRLATSGITGTSYIQAEFLDPDKHPLPEISWEPRGLYIPSAPSTISELQSAAEKLFGRLEELDIKKVVIDLDTLLVSLADAVEQLDVGRLRAEAVVLLEDLQATSATLRSNVADAKLPQVADSARGALDEANATIAGLRKSVEAGGYDLEVALENVRVATEDLRALADTLRSQPSLLLRSGAPAEAESVDAP